jgi:hypothetical protein
MASLKEVHEAYVEAQRTHGDVLFWQAVYCERLVMLCDGVGDRARVGRIDGGEQERGGGVI